jgi:hypothetical protein
MFGEVNLSNKREQHGEQDRSRAENGVSL